MEKSLSQLLLPPKSRLTERFALSQISFVQFTGQSGSNPELTGTAQRTEHPIPSSPQGFEPPRELLRFLFPVP
jgi:hypothetical protein